MKDHNVDNTFKLGELQLIVGYGITDRNTDEWPVFARYLTGVGRGGLLLSVQ
ncbi:MAG: hypothetical protein ACYTBZ_20605 [Planctomycetota bacterium]|jgi:hypothetical protein